MIGLCQAATMGGSNELDLSLHAIKYRVNPVLATALLWMRGMLSAGKMKLW